MNKKNLFLLAFLLIGALLFSQKITPENWKNMSENERREVIKKMNPEEKKELLKRFKENMMIAELQIPKENENEFRVLYTEYQESQKQIKSKFSPKQSYENVSEGAAQKELENSFEIGQQLLDNRKKYSQKFLHLLKPQQVLQLFQNEGKNRNRENDRQNSTQNQYEKPHFKNDANSEGFRNTKRP